MDPLVGHRIAHYRILALLGGDGMGRVYRARDERLERDVALKLLPVERQGDSTARARLVREAQIASRLNHPHIAHVYEVGEDGGSVYATFELVDGITLEKAIPPRGMAPDALLECAIQIAEGLACGHEHGVVHRDLKGANVMITPEGVAKVIDFGIARELDDGRTRTMPVDPVLTVTDPIVGTLSHLPPEVLRHGQRADARGDVWAFGIVLYQMTSGHRPFHGETWSALVAAIVDQPTPPLDARVPAGLQAVIARCLEKDPERRYRHGGEVWAALERLRGGMQARAARRRGWATAAAAILVLAAAAVAVRPELGSGLLGPGPAIRSLAVLPLENLTGDPAQEYFVDGMTEELITRVATIPNLKVISRTSVMRYKGTTKPASQIMRDLRVDAVVEGSVQRDGDRVRIFAQLIDDRDHHLWAKKFDREVREVLVLQSDVAQAIAQEISRELVPGTAARRPVNPEAYELYLQGRHLWSRMNDPDVRRSIELFEQSRAIDPGDARASSGLADAYLVLVQVLGTYPAREGMVLALDNARRAIAADSTSADAHTSAAAALYFERWDRTAAWREIQTALALNPNHAHAHLVASAILDAQGKFEQAIEMDRRALELDPYSILLHWHASRTLRMAGRIDDCLAVGEKGLRLDPAAPSILGSMVGACEQVRRYEEALALRARAAAGDSARLEFVERLRQAHARRGEEGYLRAAVDDLRQRLEASPEATMPLALLYCRLGERSRSLDYLERAHAEHSSDLLYLGAEPGFARLRGEPRFAALLRRIPSS